MRQAEDKTKKMENRNEKTLNEKLKEAENIPGFRNHLAEMLKQSDHTSNFTGFDRISPSVKDLKVDLKKQGGVYLLEVSTQHFLPGILPHTVRDAYPAEHYLLVGGFLKGKSSEHPSIAYPLCSLHSMNKIIHCNDMDSKFIYEEIMGFRVECDKINATLKCRGGTLREVNLDCYLNPDPLIKYTTGFG